MSTTLGKLREYETVLVVNPDLTDEVVNGDIVDRLKGVLDKQGAELLREDRWGKRKMAFEAKKHSRGNYILLHYAAKVGAVEELERIMRNMEPVTRFTTSRIGEVVDIEAKKAEVDKMVKERAAAKAKQEAERREQEAQAAAAEAAAEAQPS
ncbi:MAG: 30S ribosomal protein S6 [Myxococcota bacterium]